MKLFDTLGPVMVGPSSSHTAGAVKIGYITRKLLGNSPVHADITLYGSFAATGAGHGTDRALIAGLLGMKPDDIRVPDSFSLAKQSGLDFCFALESAKRGNHPNTAKLIVTDLSGNTLEVVGASVGGGRVRICEIDGIRTDFSGDYHTIIDHNTDTPGHVAQVTTVLAQKNINIASMQLYRNVKGGYAVMILECDDKIPENMLSWLKDLDGILKITSYNREEDI